MPGFVNRPSRVSPGRKRRIHVVLSHMLTHNFYILGILFLFLYNRQYLTVTWGIRNNFFAIVYMIFIFIIRNSGSNFDWPGEYGIVLWNSPMEILLRDTLARTQK